MQTQAVQFKYNRMRGRPPQRRKDPKGPNTPPSSNNLAIITHSLRPYSHQNLAWLRKTERILHKPRDLLNEIQCSSAGEWLQRCFGGSEGRAELSELIQYYKYYRCSPLLAEGHHFDFMNAYWSRSKTIYYMKIKHILQIEQHEPEETLQKNITNEEGSKTGDNRSTFYLMPQLHNCHTLPHDNTLEKILSSLQRQGNDLRGRTIKDIDKAYKFNREQSKTKDRHSQQRSHLKTNPSNLVSQFSYKPSTKKKKQNHKSLSNEPQSPGGISKGKKLAATNSCMSIAAHDSNLNYMRRDKNHKNSQKQLRNIKRQGSQMGLNEQNRPLLRNHSKTKPHGSHNDYMGSHKKGISNQRSSEGVPKSKSSKKRVETQSNVKAAIDKTKHKIKMQKSIMLKKYVDSRQSYTKSIDSTCGEVLKHPRK